MEDFLREVTWFFQTNDTPECAPGLIWVTHKAVIHGVLIKHRAMIKCERDAKLTSLQTDIHRLELLHKYAPLS